MTYIACFAVGVLSAVGCIWGGFYLGRLKVDEVPSAPSLPEDFGGTVLDYAGRYPDEDS